METDLQMAAKLQQTLQTHCRLPIRKLIKQTCDEIELFPNRQQIGDDICLLGFTLHDLV